MGGVEGAVFGVLVFVLGTLVIANGWGVVDAKAAAGSAAREATRAFVESRATTTEEALSEAERAGAAAMEAQGRDPARMVLEAEEAELARCARVTFRVDYPVPLISLPLIGRQGRGFVATARHTEIVDPYRSGLAGATECPRQLVP